MRSLCWTLPLFLSLPLTLHADWTTFGGDPQRTGLQKDEAGLTKGTIKGLKLNWKLKLDQEPVELNSLTAPLVQSQVNTPAGLKEIVLVAGASDKVFAIDANTGKIVWQKSMTVNATPRRPPHWLCPNALNATPVIDGASRTAYVLSSDGKLHAFNLVNGEDLMPPTQFVPPFAKAWSLNLYKNVVYTAISQNCNGVLSGVHAFPLKTKEHTVSRFNSTNASGAGIWGRGGAAISANGMVVVATGDGPYDAARGRLSDTIIGLSTPDLKLADYYTPENRAWITQKDLDMGNVSPVVFKYNGREMAAGAGKEGVIYLVDLAGMGGPDHRTPAYRSSLLANEEVRLEARGFWGGLSSWEDSQGRRWLYAPALGPQHPGAPRFSIEHGEAPQGSVMAFTVETKDRAVVLVPRWRSRDMGVPEPVVIASGMVFALANGESTTQVTDSGGLFSSQERTAAQVSNATLYAFDAETGKELWSSGKTIPGFSHFSAPVVSGGRAYVVTHDGMLYAFGLASNTKKGRK